MEQRQAGTETGTFWRTGNCRDRQERTSTLWASVKPPELALSAELKALQWRTLSKSFGILFKTCFWAFVEFWLLCGLKRTSTERTIRSMYVYIILNTDWKENIIYLCCLEVFRVCFVCVCVLRGVWAVICWLFGISWRHLGSVFFSIRGQTEWTTVGKSDE